MKVIALCTLFIGMVLAADLRYQGSNYNKGNYDYGAPMPFSFGYAVKDEYYNDYAHDTTSDGRVRTGTYRTFLPDGRLQIVTYKADANGYVADVKYQGEAKYDIKPAYKPASPPAYPKPTYPKPSYP